jgi:hypothetical protein
MTFAAKGPPPGLGGDPLELSSLGGVDLQANIPNEAQAQAGNRNPAEFDAEIALALAASHWRTAALFLNLTAQYAEAGDCLSLDRNRRRAREQFLEANEVFRQFQEARAAEGASLWAEAFL